MRSSRAILSSAITPAGRRRASFSLAVRTLLRGTPTLASCFCKRTVKKIGKGVKCGLRKRGNIYTITATAVDADGNSAAKTIEVIVPFSQRR